MFALFAETGVDWPNLVMGLLFVLSVVLFFVICGLVSDYDDKSKESDRWKQYGEYYEKKVRFLVDKFGIEAKQASEWWDRMNSAEAVGKEIKETTEEK